MMRPVPVALLTQGIPVVGAGVVGAPVVVGEVAGLVVGEIVGDAVGDMVGEITVGLMGGESVRHVNVWALESQPPATDANVAVHALLVTSTE